jgi:hypothetical protein
MEADPAEEIRTIISSTVRSMSNNDRIGNCPWCKAVISMREKPISRCTVCWKLVNWNSK